MSLREEQFFTIGQKSLIKPDNDSSWLPMIVTTTGLFLYISRLFSGAIFNEEIVEQINKDVHNIWLKTSFFLIVVGLTASSFDNFVNKKNPKKSLYESLE